MAIFKKSVSKRRSIKKMSRKAKGPYAYHKYPRPMSAGTGGAVNAGRITRLGNSDFGFPDRLKTKLIYCDVIQLSSTLGSVADYVFRLNSLYDPDYTSTGHHPQWWAQLTAVYDHYRVLGSKITCRFVPNSVCDTPANVRGPFIVGVTGSDSSALSASSYPTLLEDGSSNNAIIVDRQGSANVATVSQTFSPKRDLGQNPYDDTLSAATTTNPSKQFFAHVWAKDMSTANATSISVQVQIEFQCEFFGRIEGVLST